MKRIYYPAAVCAIGLLCSEFLFSILVFFSNQAHYHKLLALKNAGYLMVPNEKILPFLLQPGPALAGGLFFTLTAGAGLTLLTFGLIFLWRRFWFKRRFILLPVLAGSALLILINRGGINYPVTAIFILLSAAVAAATLRLYPETPTQHRPLRFRGIIIHPIVWVILAGVWMPQVNGDTFIHIRDHLLLTHPAGKAINAFYYKYTLYPAYVFKSPDQRLLHTCRISASTPQSFSAIETRLRKEDYLIPPDPAAPVDLTVMQDGQTLSFIHAGRTIYTTGMDQFMKSSSDVLSKISGRIDNFAFFRKFTFFSLVFALPLLLYGIIYFCVLLMLFPVSDLRLRRGMSTLVVLAAGILLVLPLYRSGGQSVMAAQIRERLSSDHWTDRLAAIKEIADKKMPITAFAGIESMKNSPHIPIRYWLARSLASGSTGEAHRMALSMLSDPQPNVVCMALYSLGRQKQPSAIPVILDLINTSDHWYVQWYAYQSLKRLGWIQPRSDFSRQSSR